MFFNTPPGKTNRNKEQARNGFIRHTQYKIKDPQRLTMGILAVREMIAGLTIHSTVYLRLQ